MRNLTVVTEKCRGHILGGGSGNEMGEVDGMARVLGGVRVDVEQMVLRGDESGEEEDVSLFSHFWFRGDGS